MQSLAPKIKRALCVAALWLLALGSCGLALGAYRQYSQARSDLDVLRRTYDSQMQDYGRLLAEGEQLREDRDYQVKLLKKRFGYTEPDETPIVILKKDEDAGNPGEPQPQDDRPDDGAGLDEPGGSGT
jgi:hypothetical protein